MTRRPPDQAMWTCAKCRRAFANRNQVHTCANGSLEAHFEGKSPAMKALFDLFLARLRAIGPVTVLPQKTRIAFQVRMSFAQITPRRAWIDGHLVLAERFPEFWVRSISSLSPGNHVHTFRLTSEADLHAAFIQRLRDSYAVGEQKHLVRPRKT